MISPYIDIFINYLSLHLDFLVVYFPILVFGAALLEAIPVLGALTPGTTFLLFFGFMSSVLKTNISLIIFAAFIGTIIGDIMGFFLGKYGSEFLLRHKKLLKISHIEEGRKFFSNHGFKSVFLGKFVGPIRSIMPLIAGSINLQFSKFMFYNILASFSWVSLYIIIGYYFGNNFRIIEKYISNIGIILTILIISYVIYHFHKKNKNKKQQNEN
jgi:membrane protein DedA with SNARE-associated domain